MGLIAEASLTLERLDGRHTGNRYFRYRVKIEGPPSLKYPKYYELRKECWDIWGASSERDIHLSLWRDENKQYRNIHWCWHHDQKTNETFIYLKGDDEVSFFKLKWM